MARPPSAEREEILGDTRRRLLEAAVDEFAREGYVGANINRISRTAGFAKGTIYNYFVSKRALMLALIDEIAADHVAVLMEQMEPEMDPARRLELFFRAGYEFVEGHPARAQVIISAVYGSDAEFKDQVYRAYDLLFATIADDVVAAGTSAGDFVSVDPMLATALIMTVYLGSCSQFDPQGRIWIDPGQAVSLLLDGLRSRESSPADSR